MGWGEPGQAQGACHGMRCPRVGKESIVGGTAVAAVHPGLLADWREGLGGSPTVLWSLIKRTATLQVNPEVGWKRWYLIASIGECVYVGKTRLY